MLLSNKAMQKENVMGDLIGGFFNDLLHTRAGATVFVAMLVAVSVISLRLLFRAMLFAFEGLGITEILLRHHIGQVKYYNKKKLAGAYFGVRHIPSEIGELTQLEWLDFSRKRIEELPAAIGQLASLQRLDLESNRIAALPAEIGHLAQLRQLSLDSNRIESLPAEIGGLIRLEELGISKNRLTVLPKEIGKLTILKKLNAERNALEHLPAEIGQLTSLKLLDLSHNRLVGLPPEIGGLENLEYFDLSYNNLTHLPVELGQLPSLKTLLLKGNPLVNPPQQVVRKGTKAVLHFLREKDPQSTAQMPATPAASKNELLVGMAHNVTPVACSGPEEAPPKYFALDLDGRNIAIDVHLDSQGKWDNLIGEGDSLIAAIDTETRTREWEENGAIRQADAFVCNAYKNLSRGYMLRRPAMEGFATLMIIAISSIVLWLLLLAPETPDNGPQYGLWGGIKMIMPTVKLFVYIIAVGLPLLIPFQLHTQYGLYRAGFLVRRRALEAAVGTAQNAGRSKSGALDVALGSQSVLFPARLAGIIQDGDRIVAVGEKLTPDVMVAKSYKNLTTGASGSAASWGEILRSFGWKFLIVAGFFKGLLASLREPELLMWLPRVIAFCLLIWYALRLLEDFFAWRLRREAGRRMKQALKAAA